MQVERGEEKVSFDTPVSIDASGPWTNVRPEIETLELSSDFGALALKPESAGRLGLSGTVELGPAVSIANSFLEEPLPELAGDLQVRGAYENEKLDLELTGLVIPPSPEANPESTKPAEPLELSSRIQYDVAADRMAFENVAVKSSLAEVTGRGQIEKLVHGPRTFELDASARPDEGRVVNWLRERTDPAAELSGLDAITLKLAGPLEPALREVAVDARASFASARIWGLDVGATTIKLHSKDEMIEVAPIETTVNHGVVVVEPKIVHTADGWVLELGSQTRVDGMEVNEDVSNRLLAYVAPVLAEATRVRGRFSARVIDAVIPLDAPDLAEVTARAAFDDVQFAPGPLAMTVLGMTSLRDATLSLDQPIEFAVSDRKVYTRGLEVPIVGEGIKLTLDGAVGFDRRVALTFSLPFSPALFPRRPALAILVGGNRIDIPITGTLAEPKLDGEGLGKSFADFGLNMLERAPVAGGIGLFRALTRQRESQQQGAPMEAPRDTPGRIVPSPPLPGPAPEDTPMTREERKLERQRKAAERKAARKGIDP
jgi:translocation and assembly module TamB